MQLCNLQAGLIIIENPLTFNKDIPESVMGKNTMFCSNNDKMQGFAYPIFSSLAHDFYHTFSRFRISEFGLYSLL